MRPEIVQYMNAAHDLESLYRSAETIVLQCVKRWNKIPTIGTSDQGFSFSVIVSHIAELLQNLLLADPGLFWNGGQKDQCLKLLKPLYLGTQKLKRKLERVTVMLSTQMKVLSPLLITFSDEAFISSVVCNNKTFPQTIGQTLAVEDSVELEREVLKIVASEMNAGMENKKGFVDKLKLAFSWNSVGNKKSKTLKSLQARLRAIEENELHSFGNKNHAFASLDDVTNPESRMLLWTKDKSHCLDSEHSELNNNNKEEMVEQIVLDADAKFFLLPDTDEEEMERNEDVRNENVEVGSDCGILVIHEPPASFDTSLSDPHFQNQNPAEAEATVLFPEDPFTKFKSLTKETNAEVGSAILNIRAAEKDFYAPPNTVTVSTEIPLEIKDFVSIVEKAGEGLQQKLARNERKRRNSYSSEQIQLMKALSKVYQSGTSCVGAFELFTSMVQVDAEDLENVVQEYRVGQTSEEEYEFEIPDSEVKRCPTTNLERLFSKGFPTEEF